MSSNYEPNYFTNRELSWIDFNDRVLDEARDKRNPLLERVKFLGITQSNLDEFFMVRVASLRKMLAVDYNEPDASGMLPAEQLSAISKKVHQQLTKQYSTLTRSLLPQLEEVGIQLLKYDGLSKRQRLFVSQYFHQDLYPVLTPLAVDSSRPFPFIGNNSLYLAVRLAKSENDDLPDGEKKERRYALVQVPDVFNRVVKLPGDNQFILLEDAIRPFVNELFTGFKVKEAQSFRVIRDMDFDVSESDTSDLMKEIVQQLSMRDHTSVMRLEIENDTSKSLRKWLVKMLKANEEEVYEISGPIDLGMLGDLAKLVTDHSDLLFQPYKSYTQPSLRTDNLFSAIASQDIFLHHPYDSFSPVVNFVKEAAEDPDTLAIKMTLYRVSSHSPIIQYLGEAAQNGKQVTVLVELKARFDEENNVHWAHELEKRGCHVIYGLQGLKTHCKLLLVVRRESDGIRRYVHMATGNYNDVTANFYTDMGLFTADARIGVDASNIFNMLSGFSEPRHFEVLNIAPLTMRNFLKDRIDDEIKAAKAGRPARIKMKMNSLSDPRMISKLYDASIAGVKIDLIVRGICRLQPGIKGISENITVHSIVGRFLEHSRIYSFYSEGEEKVFLSSADLMNRNLSRRVELLFPILQENIKQEILRIYGLMWNDNLKTRVLTADGTYQRVDRRGLEPLSVQDALMHEKELLSHKKIDDDLNKVSQIFIPLTKPDEGL
ncbi:RNA degradosome polyphosphate kinase [Paucilactobacillus suebicus]|uniref:Polyphosphate kinase n=1 Tax=Paucilactobacillus suebicus DSM 5007 = KCTC 3549 TaxID=1423807 RepID=A0A0R1W2D9_9LACO|nr:polyphosphate kinase [Paucilactobacillus suebicus DSM 5007 = KCTC 3549]